jgi:hypothetical protein
MGNSLCNMSKPPPNHEQQQVCKVNKPLLNTQNSRQNGRNTSRKAVPSLWEQWVRIPAPALLHHARHRGHEIFIPNLAVSLRFTCEPRSSIFMLIPPDVTNRAVVIWLKYQLPFPPSTTCVGFVESYVRSYNIYHIITCYFDMNFTYYIQQFFDFQWINAE